MVEEYPQRPSIVPRLLRRVLFCVEPFPERFYRRSSKEHGNEMGPDSHVRMHNLRDKVGGAGRKRYASRVVTTTLPEVGVKLEFIAKEFS
jgi:hypothetical protein